MKQFTLTILCLSIFSIAFSQGNPEFNIEHKCSHSAHLHEKVLNEDLYNWQSEYLEDYDVSFYFIDIEISNTSIYINGNTTINGTALVDLDTFAIELIPEQTITQILFNGTEYTDYSRDGNNVIVPVSEISAGATFSVQIFYNGQPGSGGFFAGVSNAHSSTWNKDVTWSLSEPFAASDWFPVKQDLEDKADSVWVFLTTSSENMAGSQGLLTDIVDLGNGNSRYEWKSKYPIAYYLISFAVSEYEEYNIYAHPEELQNDSILIQNFIYNTPGCLTANKAGIDKTASMVELFSDLYSLYPFWDEKYGHCLTELGGGMEHQTMTTIGGFSFGLVAHELGHQWFGDNVTCATWSDIWINEGFATYSNYLAEEFLQGASSARTFIMSKQNSAMSQNGGSVYIPEDEIYPGNEWRIFSSRLSYNKGAAIIHILRHEIQDDELFFEVLNTFQTEFADSTATGEDFKAIAEDVTGMNFDKFFEQWYYGEGYPKYTIEYYNGQGNINISSLQTTSSTVTPLFDMLIDCKLLFEDGTDSIITLHQTENLTNFAIPMDKNVASMTLDPNKWTMEKTLGISVGVPVKENQTTFRLGQNHSKENIILFFSDKDFSRKNIDIFDISGKIVYSGETNDSQTTISISTLPKGVYIVKASTNRNDAFVKRFVK